MRPTEIVVSLQVFTGLQLSGLDPGAIVRCIASRSCWVLLVGVVLTLFASVTLMVSQFMLEKRSIVELRDAGVVVSLGERVGGLRGWLFRIREASVTKTGGDFDFRAASRLRGLTVLELDSVAIQGSCASDLGRMRGLTTISISRMDVPAEVWESIGRLPNIEMVMIADTNFGRHEARQLVGMRRLKVLFIDGCAITPETAVYLGGLEQLQWLMLSNSPVESHVIRELSRLPKPFDLELIGCELRGDVFEHMYEMRALRKLSLIATDFGSHDIENISRALSIEALMLRNRGISLDDESLNKLGEISELRSLSLNKGLFPESALAAFREANPHVRIDIEGQRSQ